MANFWLSLPKPFLVLAPLENVTDVVFREIVAGLPRPDVFFTEFTSADGLCSKGHEAVLHHLKYTENQRPIVAQLWGTNPEAMNKAAELVRNLGFDGVDINMGCPDKVVMKHGAGAALCRTPELARELIRAVRNGAGDLPVSVKTRLGFNTVATETWIPFLLKQHVDALIIHARTASQQSKGDADWKEVGKAVVYAREIAPETIVVGNGDIKNYREAVSMHERYGVDGVMIGRGIFADPWVFEKTFRKQEQGKEEYIRVLRQHLTLFDTTWAGRKPFVIMKKFFKMYINNFHGAAELRRELMESVDSSQAENVLARHGA